MYQQIIYVSRAVPDLRARDTVDIIRVAHNRNARLGLTGMLIFIDGHFLQVIEGDPWPLAARFGVIAADPRHQDVQLRRQVAVDRPSFPDSWMALRHGDTIGDDLRRRFGYEPGFPADRMPPERLLDFALACLDETQGVT